MKIKSVNSSEFITTMWSGGTTTEYYIYPQDASYKERKFKARISSAMIDDDYSKFTELKGVKRYLTPLSNEVKLVIEGKEQMVSPYEIISFSGEEAVESYGRCRDFNLMLKGTEGKMECLSVDEGKLIIEAKTIAVLYCYSGKTEVILKNHMTGKVKKDYTDKNKMLVISNYEACDQEISLKSDNQKLLICKIKSEA